MSARSSPTALFGDGDHAPVELEPSAPSQGLARRRAGHRRASARRRTHTAQSPFVHRDLEREMTHPTAPVSTVGNVRLCASQNAALAGHPRKAEDTTARRRQAPRLDPPRVRHPHRLEWLEHPPTCTGVGTSPSSPRGRRRRTPVTLAKPCRSTTGLEQSQWRTPSQLRVNSEWQILARLGRRRLTLTISERTAHRHSPTDVLRRRSGDTSRIIESAGNGHRMAGRELGLRAFHSSRKPSSTRDQGRQPVFGFQTAGAAGPPFIGITAGGPVLAPGDEVQGFTRS